MALHRFTLYTSPPQHPPPQMNVYIATKLQTVHEIDEDEEKRRIEGSLLKS